ncbi:hypothetical protein GBM46_15325 [Enterococcus faecium]|uniref:Uncharacterized protein n=1 Tax=Enterococcus faecium TaxID=1352 RepID=A0A7V8C7Q8_ENTFC|nr:hypothetical protein GBM46_15325 [Enterococcus faecium]KAB7572528.1 hypothetical protein GBM73_15630 [Enterococcus faecium]
MVHSDSDLILHNSSVLIDKEPKRANSTIVSSYAVMKTKPLKKEMFHHKHKQKNKKIKNLIIINCYRSTFYYN